MSAATAAAAVILLGVLLEVCWPIMKSVEASERLQAEREARDERAAQAQLRPERSIEVSRRG